MKIILLILAILVMMVIITPVMSAAKVPAKVVPVKAKAPPTAGMPGFAEYLATKTTKDSCEAAGGRWCFVQNKPGKTGDCTWQLDPIPYAERKYLN